MIKIGITGGIGSGKTYVARLLENCGVPVYDSDSRAKQLTATDLNIRKDLVALLGEEVYQNGVLNKELLAAYLFAGEEHAAQINGVIHPTVFHDFDSWCKQIGPVEVVGLESAILFESGFYERTDCVCVVSAPLELRIRRAMDRDGRDREAIEARIRAQMDDEEREARADYIIVNDGVQPLVPQLEKMLDELKKRKNA